MQALIQKLFGGSAAWKTTASAYVGGGIVILVELFDLIGAPIADVGNGQFEMQKVILGLGVFGIGWFAADKK